MTAQTLPFRVGFAGHRALNLPAHGKASLQDRLGAVFKAIALACAGSDTPQRLHKILEAWTSLLKPPGDAGIEQLGVSPELLIGHAAGADQLAVTAWRAAGIGRIHGVFPYCASDGSHGLNSAPEAAGPAIALCGGHEPAPFNLCTALDGCASDGEAPRREPFLELSRFVVRWADLIVAVWRGDMPDGPGGTGDTVRLALARGLPVLWIDPANPAELRLIDPRGLWQDGSFFELTRAIKANRDAVAPVLSNEALAAMLARHVARRLAPPDLAGLIDPEPPHGSHADTGEDHADGAAHGDHGDHAELPEGAARRDHEHAMVELQGHRWQIRARCWLADRWPKLRQLFSGRVDVNAYGTKPGLSSATQGEKGLALIDTALKAADDVANVYGNLHRTLQVGLMAIAVLAVFVGTLPAFLEDLKIYCVLTELLLAFFAWRIWKLRLVTSNHQRWSDARRYAERLRVIMATWPLGFDVHDDRSDEPTTWTEWRARAVLRLAGPPTGALTEARMRKDLRAARDHAYGIVVGQLDYHTLTRERMGRAHLRTHSWETWAFYGLVLALAWYALHYPLDEGALGPYPAIGWTQNAGGLLLIASATVPAFAAAIIALEAKIGFRENELRSERLEPEFRALAIAMGARLDLTSAAPEEPSVATMIESLRTAARLHIADADSWRDGATRRQIVKL